MTSHASAVGDSHDVAFALIYELISQHYNTKKTCTRKSAKTYAGNVFMIRDLDL